MWSRWCAAAVMALALTPAANAATTGWSALDVDGERVRIFRDDFGRPHIFAATNRALFTAFGYAVAEDRLWQLELNRRVSRGTLAEAFGSGSVASDVFVRTTGYTDAEITAQSTALRERHQGLFQAYADGINRYLVEAAANPADKLPFEFSATGLSVPAAFTTGDLVAICAFVMRRFGAPGGFEADHKTTLDSLTARYGAEAGYAIFQDIWWLNDSRSYGTIPKRGASASPHSRWHPRQRDVFGAGLAAYGAQLADLARHWDRLGAPNRLGSYAWVVSPRKSAHGAAMLYGGPQMGFSAPEIVLEAELKSDEGFGVTGMTIPGMPVIAIGRNADLAWTITTGLALDTLDTYAETLCDAGGVTGYVYQGACVPYETRSEVVQVRGGAAQTIPVLRSVHGPVVGKAAAVALTQKSALWGGEVEAVARMIDLGRSTNLRRFAEIATQFKPAFNVLYADRLGNIAYWAVGCNPLRPEGFDPRLPYPGDGSAEWLGGCRPVPSSINPAQGFLANWNNKPTSDYESADQGIYRPIGEIHRVDEIIAALAKPRLSLADMRAIPKRIAAVPLAGRESRALLPYLYGALDAVPPSHPLAPQARAVLEAWSGDEFADPVASTTLLAGAVVFSSWLNACMQDTFGDELGTVIGEATGNMLLHALDDALGGGSAVPPSRDYFNGQDPRAVLSQAFDQAVAALAEAQGEDPALWTAPRGVTEFIHPLLGTVASVPVSNRSTYGQIVVLNRQRTYAENIITLGQSGFIKLNADGSVALDAHFLDQLALYRRFQHKPMPLLSDWRSGASMPRR